jgi:hypothetical protein
MLKQQPVLSCSSLARSTCNVGKEVPVSPWIMRARQDPQGPDPAGQATVRRSLGGDRGTARLSGAFGTSFIIPTC